MVYYFKGPKYRLSICEKNIVCSDLQLEKLMVMFFKQCSDEWIGILICYKKIYCNLQPIEKTKTYKICRLRITAITWTKLTTKAVYCLKLNCKHFSLHIELYHVERMPVVPSSFACRVQPAACIPYYAVNATQIMFWTEHLSTVYFSL